MEGWSCRGCADGEQQLQHLHAETRPLLQGLVARSTCINNIREQSKTIKKAADLDYEFY